MINLTTRERWQRWTELSDRIYRRYRLALNVQPTYAKMLFARLKRASLTAESIAANEGFPASYYVYYYRFES